MKRYEIIAKQRERRRARVRKVVRGTTARPRLTVHRSHKNIACQVIDDTTGKTLVAASSRDKIVRAELRYGGNKAAAQVVGRAIAERAKAAGVTHVCFDRGSYKFHGRIAALASAAREAGLNF